LEPEKTRLAVCDEGRGEMVDGDGMEIGDGTRTRAPIHVPGPGIPCMVTLSRFDMNCEEKRPGDTIARVGFDGQILLKELTLALWSGGAPSAGRGLDDSSKPKAGVLAKDGVGVFAEGSVYDRCGCSLGCAVNFMVGTSRSGMCLGYISGRVGEW
jgi:hypothetical protein